MEKFILSNSIESLSFEEMLLIDGGAWSWSDFWEGFKSGLTLGGVLIGKIFK